jgi:hypothetical protein
MNSQRPNGQGLNLKHFKFINLKLLDGQTSPLLTSGTQAKSMLPTV